MVIPPIESDLTIPGLDGPGLHARFWTVDRPRGVVVIAHGLGEHGAAYGHVAEALCLSAHVDVLAFDFRGHGRSPGTRGVVVHYVDLCDDLRAAVRFASHERPGLPCFVLGHSNGGQVVLRAVLAGDLDVAGLILSNPALRLATPVPRWKIGVGRVLRRFAPNVTLETAVDLATLTSDPIMLDLRRNDTLRHSRINGPLFFGLVEGGRLIEDRADEITLPILLILGGSDPVIDSDFTSRIFDAIGSRDKTRIIYPDMLHEPLNETERARPLAAIVDWLNLRMPQR
jgi:alpha-beta hydrolase superfamily lysophospholipase